MQTLLQLMVTQESRDALPLRLALFLGHGRLRHLLQRLTVGLKINADRRRHPAKGDCIQHWCRRQLRVVRQLVLLHTENGHGSDRGGDGKLGVCRLFQSADRGL